MTYSLLAEDAVIFPVYTNTDGANLAQWLRRRDEVEEAVPTAGTVVVRFNPTRTSAKALLELIHHYKDHPNESATQDPRHHRIPVEYEICDETDLKLVADALELSRDDVIGLHSSSTYTVSHVGFLPGFAYLTGLPSGLNLPRHPTPRPRLAPGSIAIAGEYCGVYPLSSPGGWNVIGHTSLPLVDFANEDPFLLQPGDNVTFVPQ